MPNQLMLEGEYEPIAESPTDELTEIREQFSEFARVVQEQMNKLRHDVDALTKGVLIASGELSGKPSVTSGDSAGKWERVKRRLQPRLAQAIDILIVQGPMTNTQLAYALKMNRTNCSNNVTGILIRQGLVVRNGNELSLKQL